MHYPFLYLFIVGLLFLDITDACGKRPSRQTTPSYTITTMSMNTTEASTPPSSYRIPCNATEERLLSCLNGGTCFVVIIHKQRNRNCQCPAERTGSRCQELSPEIFRPIIDPNKMRTAHIAAGVVGTVIIVLVVVASVYVYYRVKRKERAMPHRHRQNGTNTSQPNVDSNGGLAEMELQRLRPAPV